MLISMLEMNCRLKNTQWNVVGNLWNVLTSMRRRKNDTLCISGYQTIDMATITKLLDIWCGDYLWRGKFMGLLRNIYVRSSE